GRSIGRRRSRLPRSECEDMTTAYLADVSNSGAKCLGLAAAPTFALMALLIAVLGSTPAGLCSAQDASLLTGMVPMYLLMSAFHLAPWLRLIANRGGSVGGGFTPQ